MLKVESVSSVTVDLLTPLESDVLSKVGKQSRWSTVNGNCYSVYGLSEGDRVNFIPRLFSDDASVVEEFPIKSIDFHSSEQLSHCKHLFDREFKDAGLLSDINLQNDDGCEAFIIGREEDKSCDNELLYIAVNDRSEMIPGKKMILTNAGRQSVSLLSKKKTLIFESRLRGTNIWLKPSESVVLEFERNDERRVWKEIGKSMSHYVSFDVNPLARQSGPVRSYMENGRSKGVDYKLDGELFLPLNVIDQLLQSKINVSNHPFLQWICTSSDSEVEAFLGIIRMTVIEKKTDQLACLVYEYLPVHHTLVATVYVKTHEVYCYFHETLGSKNRLAQRIREKLLASVKTSFFDHSIVCLFPQEAMQKDFSVCGVYAIKLMKYIAKQPRQWASFLEGYGLPETDLDTRCIQVSTLPAELLKMCQDVRLASRTQKDHQIGHKKYWGLTLAQYWRAYGYKDESRQNHAALVKLYKYYSDYAALKEADKGRAEGVKRVQTVCSGTAYKRSVSKTGNSLDQPVPKRKISVL